jgi:hypothetical protein
MKGKFKAPLQRLACSHLMDELMAERINVALPVASCGMDMLASPDTIGEGGAVLCIPIRVLLVNPGRFAQDIRSAGTPGLLVAMMGEVRQPASIQSFAFTAVELTLVKMIVLIDRAEVMHQPAASLPGTRSILLKAIESFAIRPGQWRHKLIAATQERTPRSA